MRVAPDGRVTFYLATLREARLARHVLSCGAPAAAPIALPFEARASVLRSACGMPICGGLVRQGVVRGLEWV